MLLKDTITGVAGYFYRYIGSYTVDPALGGNNYGACTCILAFVNA
jgi:hypothetical protein